MRLPLLTLAITLVLGCSPTGEDANAQGADQTSRDSGQLAFAFPAGVTIAKTKIVCGDKQGPVAEPLTLEAGDHQCTFVEGADPALTLTGPDPQFKFDDGRGPFSVRIRSGQTTTVKAALLAIDARPHDRATMGLGAYRIADYGNNHMMHNHIVHVSGPVEDDLLYNTSAVNPDADGTVFVPVSPGDYAVGFGMEMIDGARFTVAPEEQKTVVLDDPSHRARTAFRPPARNLPSAHCLGTAADQGWYLSSRNGDREYLLPESGTELEMGRPVIDDRVYTLRVDAWYDPVAFDLGPMGGTPNVVAIKRIEVPGAGGTYEIRSVGADGRVANANFLLCTPPTGTGVDVPAGKYQLAITANGNTTTSIVEAL